MAVANPLWGAPRIHGELCTLGIDVSERTVSRLLIERRRPPSQTWRTFLAHHVASAASMDFFTVPAITGRILFVLIVLSHERRRVVHFNVTEHPTVPWTAQQMVDAFPDDTAPRWLFRDRDSIYGDAFRRRVAGMAITETTIGPARISASRRMHPMAATSRRLRPAPSSSYPKLAGFTIGTNVAWHN